MAKSSPKRNAHHSRTGEFLGRVARRSAEKRGATLAIVAVAMLLLGGGISQLEFRDDPQQAMPKGHPNTIASQALIETFPGASYTGAIYVEVFPEKWAAVNAQLPNRQPLGSDQSGDGQDQGQQAINQALTNNGTSDGTADGYPGPDNITDEVYMRAMEEMFLFLVDEIPELKWGITLPSQIKLVNYTNTGVPNPAPGADPIRDLDPASFSMPGTDPDGEAQFNAAWQSYWAASLDSIKTITSGDWRVTRFGLLFEPGDETLNEIGQKLYDGVDAYRVAVRDCDAGRACELQWNAFSPESITVDPRTPNAAASYLTKTTLEDVVQLVPYVAGFVLISLFLAFRRIDTIAAMMLPMGLAGIGMLGIFGILDLAIHSVSLLVFPILMGNGIDFGIHMATGYNNARAKGADSLDAAHAAGRSAGTPLFVATLTTLAGMGLLIFSPNRLLTELGIALILGMSLLLIISLTALPAALSWTRPTATGSSALGRALERNASFWNHSRVAGVLLVAAAMAGGALAAPALSTFVIGTPAALFPEDDPQRQDFEHTNDIYYVDQEDLVSNSLVLQGDLTTPAAMAMLADMEDRIGDLPFVRDESAVSIYFALNAWIQVRGGTAGAPIIIAQESNEGGSTFPTTQAEIEALLDEMFATPLETYATFFIHNPTYEIGNFLIEIYQPDSFEELENIWNELELELAAIQADHPDANLEVHLAGGTALGYLFTAEELPYVKTAGMVGIGITGLLVLAIRRNTRDAITVAAVVGASGLIWIGALYLLDIQLSVALLVPVVMIAAIGSDYALHLRYGIADDGKSAWSTIGRAVFYSALTDVGAFLIFARMRYGLLSDATIATAAALGVTVIVTLILVPALTSRREMEAMPNV
jgi:predicted RND superfamily exporter protein